MTYRKQDLSIRSASIEDACIIKQFLHELAAHDGHGDECLISENDLIRFAFSEKPSFEILLVEIDGRPVGMALFFLTFSIWHATPCLFLSDLYVVEKIRGRGVGRAIFSRLARIAVQRGCNILEWQTLTGSDAVKFYEGLGGKAVKGFQNFRIENAALKILAGTTT